MGADKMPAAGKEVLKLEKKLREIKKIEDCVTAGGRVDPLQHQKMCKKAEVEAQLAEAKLAASEATTVASQDGSGSECFQEVEHVHQDEVVYRQWDESVREQWHQACPGFAPAAAFHQAPPAAIAAPAPVDAAAVGVPCWVPVQQMPQMQQMQQMPQQAQDAADVNNVPQMVQVQQMQVPQMQAPAFQWSQQVSPGPGQVFMMFQPAAPAQAMQPAAPEGPQQQQLSGATCPSRRQHEGRTRTDRVANMQQDCCDRLLRGLEAGGAARAAALATLPGEVRRLAMDSTGCRVVQRALEVADLAQAAELVQDLHGRVRDLVQSPHGNYVAQKVVEVLPPSLADFVARELRGAAAATARHRFGCRVLIRLMEFCADTLANTSRAAVVDELLKELDRLCRDPFGHHVVKAVLEHGHPKQQGKVIAFLCAGAANKAQDRYHSYVVETALETGPADQAEPLTAALLGSGGQASAVISLSQTRYGCNILRVMLKRTGPVSQMAVAAVRTAAPRLRESSSGHRLLRDAGLA